MNSRVRPIQPKTLDALGYLDPRRRSSSEIITRDDYYPFVSFRETLVTTASAKRSALRASPRFDFVSRPVRRSIDGWLDFHFIVEIVEYTYL